MEEHRQAVGERIAALRERAGLSQPALAHLAGIKQPSLWAIENGKTIDVTARTLISLCRALSTTLEYVWDGAGEEADDGEAEAELVAIYRQLATPGRLAVLQSARAVLAAMPPEPPHTPASDEDRAIFNASRGRTAQKAKPKRRSA